MLAEGSRADSKWAPYLAILPSNLESLVFWTDDELLELQASAVLRKIGRASAEAMFTQHLATLGLDNYNVDMCHKVASTIMAYAFDIPERSPADGNEANPLQNTLQMNSETDEESDDLVSDDGRDEITTLTMVPLADMLNADADRNNARLCCDNEDLEMRTIKFIAKGEEIFNDYGPLPQSDLLRRYGYVTDNYASYDVVELWTDSILPLFRIQGAFSIHGHSTLSPLTNEEWKKRNQLAEREDVYEESYDIVHLGPDGRSILDEMLALFYIFLVDNDTFASIEASQTALPSRSKMTTELMGQVLVTVLQLREKEYATTLEEDETLLRQDHLSHRKRMAIKVRLGEKRVLREAVLEAKSFSGSNKRMRIPETAANNHGEKRKLDNMPRKNKRGRTN